MEPLDVVLEAFETLEPKVQRNATHLVEPLASLLVFGEEVPVLASTGLVADRIYLGLLALTDRRLIFVTVAGLRGKNVQSIDVPYSSISGISVTGSRFSAVVEVASHTDSYGFDMGRQDHANELASLIRETSDAFFQEASTPTPPDDPLDQLEKLARLRDSGVITEAEFSAKKADLLNQI